LTHLANALRFQPEEVEPAVGRLVQPIKGRPVFFRERVGDPNDGGGLEPVGIGDELAQMRVVGALELVLDEHPPARRHIRDPQSALGLRVRAQD
jgi:hypothetical protein